MEKNEAIVSSGSGRNKISFLSLSLFKTDYVTSAQDNQKIIYEILSVNTVNNRLDDPNFIRFMRNDDSLEEYNVFQYEAVPLMLLKPNGQTAYVDRWQFALPGSRVEPALEAEIAIANGVEEAENKLRIGFLTKSRNISCWLNFYKIFRFHTAVLGKTGCGKTYFMLNLLKNLNLKFKIFTPTDEYDNKFPDSSNFSRESIVLDYSPHRFRHMFDLNQTEARLLSNYVAGEGLPDVVSTYDLADGIRNYYINKYIEATKVPAKTLAQMILPGFENEAAVSYSRDVKLPRYVETLCEKIGKHSILIKTGDDVEAQERAVYNLQELDKEEEEIVVYNILTSLYNKRKRTYKNTQEQDIPNSERVLIVIEEAHIYAPSQKAALCKSIITDIGRTGRKYGLHLVLLSQRPRHIDQTVLSNCSNILIFNLPNPDDVEYLMNETSFNNPALKSDIQTFRRGQCHIKSDVLETPLICDIEFNSCN